MTDTAHRPVLVFDSGIGGLTVLREARVLMPQQHFVYVADDAGFPYGAWPDNALCDHLLELFARLIADHAPALVIIACNTASTLVLDDLRQAFPAISFVGTVPAIKPAAERTRSGLISVLATPGTVERAYTRDLIQSFAAQCHVRLVGSLQLAGLAERHVRRAPVDDALIRAEIIDCFLDRQGRRTDIIVLACTHYPFLANVFRRLAPWPVDWLDPAEAIARRACSILDAGNEAASCALAREVACDHVVFTSGNPDFAICRLMQGFGLALRA